MFLNRPDDEYVVGVVLFYIVIRQPSCQVPLDRITSSVFTIVQSLDALTSLIYHFLLPYSFYFAVIIQEIKSVRDATIRIPIRRPMGCPLLGESRSCMAFTQDGGHGGGSKS